MNIEEKEKALAEKERKFMESMKGRTMAEISSHPESKKLDEERKALADERRALTLPRTRMLTVRKLIDFLSKQNPDACVLAYEPNSFAYIEQFPDLPNPSVCTVADAKKRAEESWRGWFKDSEDAGTRVKEKLDEEFRYAQDDDVIIEF
jgi:hypothetical protein